MDSLNTTNKFGISLCTGYNQNKDNRMDLAANGEDG